MKIKLNAMIVGLIPAIIFGFSFMFTKLALNIFKDSFHLLALRFSFAIIVMEILKNLKLIKIKIKGKNIKIILILSLFQPIFYFVFETIGVKISNSSQAGVMIAFSPILVSVLAVIFLKEKTNIKQILFILTSITGVIIINSNIKFTFNCLYGSFLLLGAAASSAIFQILSRKLSKIYTAIEITYVMMWVGAIVFNVIAIINALNNNMLGKYLEPLLNLSLLGTLFYLGILSSVFAFFIINYVLSQVEATKAAILANITTIVAIIAGVLILKESFDGVKLAGSTLILIGVYGTVRVKV